MKNLLATPLLAFLSAAIPAIAAVYTPVDGGITVEADSGQRVRVTLLGENLVRVSATAPGSDFATDNSLVVLPREKFTDFTVKDEGNRVILSSKAINVAVNRADGQVSFYDPMGRLLLAEDHGGRSFTPIEVEGTKGWTVSQSWASPDPDEGLYGLGQHQSDEWNYKGKNEELFQYNTKVSVPFVVSTGGYGLLWDSYSLCRFGNPDDYLQLGDAFTLYDKEGRPGALTGTYTGKNGRVVARREPNIYFEHLVRGDLSRVVNLPEDFAYNGSTVVYEGEIEPDTSGDFNFIMYYSGYQKIYIDGKLVVPERWRTSWNPNSYKFSVNLLAGRRVPIRVEWRPDGGVAYCGLRAYKPVDAATRDRLRWWGEMQDMIDYYFIASDNIDGVISVYRTLTGNAPVMPRWAMGF